MKFVCFCDDEWFGGFFLFRFIFIDHYFYMNPLNRSVNCIKNPPLIHGLRRKGTSLMNDSFVYKVRVGGIVKNVLSEIHFPPQVLTSSGSEGLSLSHK